MNLRFLVNVAYVGAYGVLGYAKYVGDAWLCAALRKEYGNLFFTCGEMHLVAPLNKPFFYCLFGRRNRYGKWRLCVSKKDSRFVATDKQNGGDDYEVSNEGGLLGRELPL